MNTLWRGKLTRWVSQNIWKESFEWRTRVFFWLKLPKFRRIDLRVHCWEQVDSWVVLRSVMHNIVFSAKRRRAGCLTKCSFSFLLFQSETFLYFTMRQRGTHISHFSENWPIERTLVASYGKALTVSKQIETMSNIRQDKWQSKKKWIKPDPCDRNHI